MNHTEIRRNLSAYLDNELNREERNLVEAHLAECPSCRKALQELARTIETLRSLPQEEPPPWLTARIMARVRSEAKPKSGFWQALLYPLHVKLPLEALALLCICITGYYLARSTSPEMQLTEPPPREMQAQQPLPPRQEPGGKPSGTGQPQKRVRPVGESSPPTAKGAEKRAEYAPPPPQGPADTGISETRPAALQQSPAPATRRDSWRQGYETRQSDAVPQPAAEPEWRQRRESVKPGAVERKAAANFEQEFEPAGRRYQTKTHGAWQNGASPSAFPGGQATQLTMTLVTADPEEAADAIEKAITDLGGRVIRRAYEGESRSITVSMERSRVTELIGRMERIGRLQNKPETGSAGSEMVEIIIRW